MLLMLAKPLTQERRRLAIEAVNQLLELGLLPASTHYAFVKKRGFWGVELWSGDRLNPGGGVAWMQLEELYASTREAPLREALAGIRFRT
jgi:hypothetical protein